ncbi:MAG: chorismate-binding protein [Caldisphaera sp.]
MAVLENSYDKKEVIIAYDSNDYIKSLYDPLTDLHNLNNKRVIGYISYDSIRYWEKIKYKPIELENWPFAEFFLPKKTIIIKDKVNFSDDDEKSCINYHNKDKFKVKEYDYSHKKEDYEDDVNEILKYIHSGYAFQVVLSRFLRYSFSGDPLELYLKLRKISPSPYLYFLKFYKRYIIGASPELLFELNNNDLITYPIAGTRPRGKSSQEDIVLENELRNSTKDRAEHLMLLDLARNDLGKVCAPGTVDVPESFFIKKYSHVQHIVSKVVGKLDENKNVLDVIKAMFPAGTVSGAPKPFSMNLINSLEIYNRGPYAGAVGYISKSRSSLAISIRSAFINNDLIRIQAGAGIVYDSIPELEYEETEHKLKSLKVSMGVK